MPVTSKCFGFPVTIVNDTIFEYQSRYDNVYQIAYPKHEDWRQLETEDSEEEALPPEVARY